MAQDQLGGHELGLVVRMDRDKVAGSSFASVSAAERFEAARALAVQSAIGERGVPRKSARGGSRGRTMGEEFLELEVNPEDAAELEPTDENTIRIQPAVFESPQDRVYGVVIESLQLVPVSAQNNGPKSGSLKTLQVKSSASRP